MLEQFNKGCALGRLIWIRREKRFFERMSAIGVGGNENSTGRVTVEGM